VDAVVVLVAATGAVTDTPLDPEMETTELGSEVLGGRRLVKAAAAATAVTAPCGSGLPPRVDGAGVATPPTGGTRGAGVGTSPVASAAAGEELSSLQSGVAAVVALMPEDI
jgi:hypothetical protein